MRSMRLLLLVASGAVLLSGCAQMAADAVFGDKYAKTASISRPMTAPSPAAAMKAAVTAAGVTGWTPKLISPETSYMLAELVPDTVGTRGMRDYTFRMEVRLPDKARGDVNVIVTPPQGVIANPTPDQYANKYLDAFTSELAKLQR